MFEFIKGFIAGKDSESVVVDVNGVGFKIFTSQVSAAGCEEGENVKFFTYLSVKEDDISLYGFLTLSELRIFKELINVNGVGPKVAISVLSQISVSDSACSSAVTTMLRRLSRIRSMICSAVRSVTTGIRRSDPAGLCPMFRKESRGGNQSLHGMNTGASVGRRLFGLSLRVWGGNYVIARRGKCPDAAIF